MKAIKKPKARNLPKKPNAKAGVEKWEKWEKDAKAIKALNQKDLADYEKKVKSIIADKKKKAEIIKRTKGLGKI